MIGGIIACQLSIDDFATKECLFTYVASICKLVTHTTLPINIYIYMYPNPSDWLVKPDQRGHRGHHLYWGRNATSIKKHLA